MRLRKKHWARPELESSGIFIGNPGNFKGKWKSVFNNDNEIYLELGCGMGQFISQNALMHPNVNYIGIDLKDEVLVNAKRRVEDTEIKAGKLLENVRLIAMQIAFINDIFEENEISRIYINFCNPWPKIRHNKRRLTHSVFLERYKKFIKPGTEIWFKTDDKPLFEESQTYFKERGFSIEYLTYDLHGSRLNENIKTEYEEKFSSMGMNIMFLIAKLVVPHK